MKHILGVLIAAALAACGPTAAEQSSRIDLLDNQWRDAAVQAVPIEIGYPPEMLRGDGGVLELGPPRIGSLIFRGGLALDSSEELFGGLSDLEILDDGSLLAVSDRGLWFSANLQFDADGQLVGLEQGRLALMRDEAGAPFARKEDGDAEDLAQMPDGRFAVSFEQSQTVRIYDFNRDGPFGAAEAGPALGETRQLAPNAGLEALATEESGALIAGAEGGGRGALLWRAWPGAEAPAPPLGRYALGDGFSLVGLDRLPDGSFVALERAYAPLSGARARITHFGGDALASGAQVIAEEWAVLRRPLLVDNFEGIAAVRRADGGVRIYIVSDDNYSARQRTLIFAFDVAERPAP